MPLHGPGRVLQIYMACVVLAAAGALLRGPGPELRPALRLRGGTADGAIGGLSGGSGGAAVALAAGGDSGEPDRRSLQEELTARYTGLSAGLDPSIAAAAADLAARVVDGLTATATDAEVDQLAAETAAYLTSHHPDYSKLAARVTVKRIHNHTSDSFADTMEALANYRHPRKGTPAPLVKQEFAELARKLAPRLEGAMRYERDFGYDYFGLRTLVRSYLLGLTPAGTPQEHRLPLPRWSPDSLCRCLLPAAASSCLRPPFFLLAQQRPSRTRRRSGRSTC